MATIAESTTATVSVTAGKRYVFSIAGTWDGMTATLAWYDGTSTVTIQAFTANGSIEFVAPTNTVKLTTGADSSNAGALIYGIFPIL
jgi:hypothetical protein